MNAANATLKIAGTLLSTGTLTATANPNTIEFNALGNQNIKVNTYFNLTLSNSGTKTFGSSTTINNMLTLSGTAIGDVATNTVSGAGGLTMSGSTELKISKTVVTVPELTGGYFLSGGTITLNQSGAATQIARGVGYYNIKLDGGNASSIFDCSLVTDALNNFDIINLGKMTSNGILTVSGNFTHSTTGTSVLSNNMTVVGNTSLSNGTFNINAKYFTALGDITLTSGTLTNNSSTIELSDNAVWINNGGTFNTTAGTVLFTGIVSQSIGGSSPTTFVNLTVNNLLGITLTVATTTVTGTLTFTSGVITTGSNKVIISSTGSVSRTSGHINGNEQRNVATGNTVSRVFDIGDGTNYSPVTLLFASVSVAGDVTASAMATDHSQIASSIINGNKSVNRFWTMSNSGTTFTTFSPTFTFVAGDIDAGANTSNFLIGGYASSAWTYPTIGTRTATTTAASGVAAFGDFAIAECATAAGAASSSPTLCINTALTNITHTTTGATGIGTATGLPAGVTAAFASNTITISGTDRKSVV